MTGILGCRWHRYKQSTRDSRKRDLLWFVLFVLTFLFITFLFYFWLVAKNDYDDLNWQMLKYVKTWLPWYRIMLGLTCVSFGYLFIVMFLYLCHAIHGHQLYIHPVHIILISLTFLSCIAMCIALDNQWSSEWTVIYLSLQITGPFLQVGAVTILTALTWLISGQWFKIAKIAVRWGSLLFYIAVMIGLYISPLYIKSPCVIEFNQLPLKPKIIAHRGDSGRAPENTMISFQKAHEHGAYGFESDVVISKDGVPYLMHDSTLRRTTNVKEIFPELADQHVSWFNFSDVEKLNAGQWFLDTDPMWNVGDLTEADKEIYSKQKIPTLTEMVRLANKTGKIVMFDLRLPPKGHPYYNTSVQRTIEAVEAGGLDLERLWWLEETKLDEPRGVFMTAEWAQPVDELKKNNITNLNVRYTEITADQIRSYKKVNISTNVWIVNTKWFFSFYWCIGTDSITSNHCEMFQNMETPVWHLSPQNYLILWVTVDVLSVVIITVMFIVQRVRLYGTSFSPETISLNAAKHKNGYKSRNMKEQLLRTEGGLEHFDDLDRTNMGVLNQPVAYSMASIPGDSSYMPYREPEATRPDAKYEVE
ncbi:hypothetical protein SNE40_000969 [Patella caerulea]|uniref:GP-PDE domain-containing protein n=2 Tax=Patella caerulea TaxID=87958 RepID=A0AAN8KIC6_PATCE